MDACICNFNIIHVIYLPAVAHAYIGENLMTYVLLVMDNLRLLSECPSFLVTGNCTVSDNVFVTWSYVSAALVRHPQTSNHVSFRIDVSDTQNDNRIYAATLPTS